MVFSKLLLPKDYYIVYADRIKGNGVKITLGVDRRFNYQNSIVGTLTLSPRELSRINNCGSIGSRKMKEKIK